MNYKQSWYIEGDTIKQGANIIAAVNLKELKEGEANLHLICAAPEMLAMLKIAMSTIQACRKLMKTSPHDDGIPIEFFMQDLIQKAEGINNG